MKQRCTLLTLLVAAQGLAAMGMMGELRGMTVRDCEPFGDLCSVCTYTDDFTDEVTHELSCDSDLDDSETSLFYEPGWVAVGCTTANIYAVLARSPFVEPLDIDSYASVRYRFDDRRAQSGDWVVKYNLGSEGYSVSLIYKWHHTIVLDIARGISLSEQMIYEVEGSRSRIEFSQPEPLNAVKELQQRCNK